MTAQIVQKLWNYYNVLRDDGMSYVDYPSTSLRAGSEQLALTSTLSQRESGKLGEMADERSRPPYKQPSPVPAGYDWPRLAPSPALPRKRERGFSWGDDLFDHYRHMLEELGKQKGLLGLIFNKWHGGSVHEI